RDQPVPRGPAEACRGVVIVLDEHLLGRQIDRDVKKWYRGKVCFITDLRPGTVIKDEVIPALLRRHRGSLFVTINERDFWRRSPADPRYCIACLVLSDARASAVPELLRRLLRHPQLRTAALRSGKVLRVTRNEVSFYTHLEAAVQRTPL
ncbi:MAG: hypothetical protein ACREKH_14825, partial [Candidatus Rokuibacteriota bacterium]